MDSRLEKQTKLLAPAIEGALDAVCIVDTKNHVVFMNLQMKHFLNIKPREMRNNPVFCNHVKLSACEGGCQLEAMLRNGLPLRMDESPAVRGTDKVRVLLKGIPLQDIDDKNTPEVIGALIYLRDTTGEILLQAKYHKLILISEEKSQQIEELQSRIEGLKAALRRGRSNAA